MNKKEVQNAVNLIQGSYNSLYLGLFLNEFIKNKDISGYAEDTPINTGENTTFTLKGSSIKSLLEDIYKNPTKRNVFGYITTLNIIHNISSNMRELIDNSKIFKEFLDKNLKEKSSDLEQVIRFTRNVLSHSTSTPITLKREDYEKQKIYLLGKNKHLINFNFKYSKFFPKEWNGDKNYGLNIKINFKKLNEGDKFLDIISYHNLFLLAEFSYNLTEIFKYKKGY